jgi:hypothetical protein
MGHFSVGALVFLSVSTVTVPKEPTGTSFGLGDFNRPVTTTHLKRSFLACSRSSGVSDQSRVGQPTQDGKQNGYYGCQGQFLFE